MCPGDENAREAEQDQYPSMALALAIPAHEKSGNVKSHKRHGDVTEIRNQFRFVMRRNKAKLHKSSKSPKPTMTRIRMTKLGILSGIRKRKTRTKRRMCVVVR